MKNVANARGEFFRFGHGVVTAPESHYYYNGGLAPCVSAREGAITVEVMIAMNRIAIRKNSTEYVESEVPSFLAPSSVHASENMGMNNLIHYQIPKHFSRAAIEDSLRKITNRQEALAHTLWDIFQSLGYRLDKHDIQLDTIRDRLWKIEHPQNNKGGDIGE